jgi:hypothetical protein
LFDLGTWILEFGFWNLDFGTWILGLDTWILGLYQLYYPLQSNLNDFKTQVICLLILATDN